MAASSDRGGTASAASALGQLLSGPLGKGLSRASAAAKAWYAANGDRERAHTTGVWLQKSGREGIDPVLVVSLDSNLLAMELGTNKDLYLSRLAFHGVVVSDIRFTVRKRQGPPRGGGSSLSRAKRASGGLSAQDGTDSPVLPELSEKEKIDVAKATEDLPDGLKQSVSRAMCASLRRHKANHT